MEKGLYYCYGLCIALCMLHGGSGPKCFALIFYKKLVLGERNYVSGLQTIAHAAPYHKLLKVRIVTGRFVTVLVFLWWFSTRFGFSIIVPSTLFLS